MSLRKLALAAIMAASVPALVLAAQGPAPGAPPAAAPGAAPAGGGGGRGPAPPARSPSLELSIEMAQTAIADCATRNYNVSALVTDVGGATKVWLRSDAAGNNTLTLPWRKIYTMRLLNMTGAEVAAANTANPAIAARIAADPNASAFAGALEIRAGADHIGYISVSGAPGGQFDEACAKAGIDKVQARLR